MAFRTSTRRKRQQPVYDPRLAMWDREYRRQRAAGVPSHEAAAAADARYPDPNAPARRGLGAIDANTLEQWNGKRFRMPDAFDGGAAIWYGPGGADGEHATVATFAGNVIVVEEYTYVVGLIEDPEQDYAVQSTRLDFADVEAAVHSVGGGGGFTTNLQVLRWAASIGVAKLAYWGGEEFWARALPRRVYDRTAE